MPTPSEHDDAAADTDGVGETSRQAQFLAEMDRVVPWTELCAVIESFYPKAGSEGGRRRCR